MPKFKMKQACIFLGERCNLSCKYCYNKNKPQFKGVMTKKQILQIVNFLSTTCDDTLWISFSGGEPFLHPQLIMHAIKEFEKKIKNTKFNITTNGTILNKQLLNALIKADTHICVSLDGNEQTHNESRSKSYDKTIKFIKFLQNKGYEKLRVRMTVQPFYANQLSQNISHLINLGIKEIHFAPNYETNWTNSQINSFFKQVEKMPKHKAIIEPISTYLDFGKPFTLKKGPYEHNCGLLLTFAPNGNIYPCPRLVFEETCKISTSLSASQILLGTANWFELLQTVRDKIGSNFFCPANNLKLNHNIYAPLPIFKKFEVRNELMFNPKIKRPASD